MAPLTGIPCMAGTGTGPHDSPARHTDPVRARDLVHAPRPERPQTPDQGTAGGRDLVCGVAGLDCYFTFDRPVSGWRAVPCAEGCVCYVAGCVIDVGGDAGDGKGGGGVFVSGGRLIADVFQHFLFELEIMCSLV